MDETEKILYNNVGQWLHEMSWICNYPINHEIGLWSFFEACREGGLDVSTSNKAKAAHFGIIFTGDRDPKLLETDLTFDQILEGWKHGPKGCPRSLYDSMYLVFDKFGESLNESSKRYEFTPATDRFSRLRSGKPRDMREHMERVLREYFNEYQENMLLPTKGKVPKLEAPQLFARVMRTYPLEVFRKACVLDDIESKEGSRSGYSAERLAQLKNWRFTYDNHPSGNAMTTYFWAIYLEKLSKDKGYPRHPHHQGLKSLIESQEKAFKDGGQINWKYQLQ